MRINHNIAALNTHRQLGSANAGQAKSMEKLASGLRINRAGDDAAGLAISEKMRGQIRGLDMAQRNSQDGISMIQTAEGALNETHSILQRMRELAVQSSNDTNTLDDREEIQKEINELTSEINRIGNTTEFNTKKLLNGDLASDFEVSGPVVVAPTTVNVTKAIDQTVIVGAEPVAWSDSASETDFDVSFTGTAANGFDWSALDTTLPADNQLVITKDGTGFDLSFNGVDTGTNTLDITAEALAYDATTDTFSYDNHGISFSFTGTDAANWADTESVTIELNKANSASGDVTSAALNSIPVAQDWATNTSTIADPAALTNFVIDGDSSETLANAAQVSINFNGSELVIDMQDAGGVSLSSNTLSWDGTAPITYSENGISFDLDAGDAGSLVGTFALETATAAVVTDAGSTTPAVIEDRSAVFQIGANQNQAMSLSFSDMRSAALNITGSGAGYSSSANVTNGTNSTLAENALDVTSASSAASAISVLDDAIKSVSAERSKLGASQNRLEHTINNLGTSSENLTAAESRIRDVDMAKEMMEQTKQSILAQASQAMLAQANQAPQGVLQLLR